MNLEGRNHKLCLFGVCGCEIVDDYIRIEEHFLEKCYFLSLTTSPKYVYHFSYSSRHWITTVGQRSSNYSVRVLRVLLLVPQPSHKMLSKKGVQAGDEVFDGFVWRWSLDSRLLFFGHKL